jgi:acyl-CoA synthetase (AMP-forming)/AMP-acid ligase II
MTSFSRIHHLLEWQATHAPDAIAITSAATGEMTFADWWQAAGEFANLLQKAHVQPGHRIMMVAENSAALAVALMATSLLDAWSVPVNARLSASEIARIAAHARPAATLYTHSVSTSALAHAQGKGAKEIAVGDDRAMLVMHDATVPEAGQADAHQVATLLYTTGTTGDPKGVMLTHSNLLAAGKMSADHRGISPDDHVYGVLPLTHVFGLSSVFMAALSARARIELVPRFDAAATFAALQSRVSIFPAVPQMHALLMAHAAENAQKHLKAARLKYISSGGAPLDLAWKRKVEAFFGLPLYNGYGLTETTAGIAATRPGGSREDTSAGKALGEQQLRIDGADADGIGEIVARGPNIMKGYYRNEAETAKVLDADGWFKTGDLGFLDSDGNLHITGRKKELIIRSGFNVYPLEVEAALNQHEAVVQAAVIGHKRDGNEEVVAFVHPVAGAALTSEILKAHLRDRLAAYKHPTRWIFSNKLPAAPSGKILKARLTKVFAGELEQHAFK